MTLNRIVTTEGSVHEVVAVAEFGKLVKETQSISLDTEIKVSCDIKQRVQVLDAKTQSQRWDAHTEFTLHGCKWPP